MRLVVQLGQFLKTLVRQIIPLIRIIAMDLGLIDLLVLGTVLSLGLLILDWLLASR